MKGKYNPLITYGEKSKKNQEELLNNLIKLNNYIGKKRKKFYMLDEEDSYENKNYNNQKNNYNNKNYFKYLNNITSSKKFYITNIYILNNKHIKHIDQSKSSNKEDDSEISSSINNNITIKNNNKITIKNNNIINVNAPWLTQRTKLYRGIIRLHYELIDFYNFIHPSDEEQNKIKNIYLNIKNIIESKYKNKLYVVLFGSTVTKLNLPNSDIDICVLQIDKYTEYNDVLLKIKYLLEKERCLSDLKLINAKIPIIKGKYLYEGKLYNIDISFGHKNGCYNSKKIYQILKVYPFLRILIIFLKFFLKERELNDTYTGGLSSFCLFSLVYAFFLYFKKEYNEDNNNNLNVMNNNKNIFYNGNYNNNNYNCSYLNLGTLLIEFLNFYCFKFNYYYLGISIRFGGFFYKRKDREFHNNSKDDNDNILSLENWQDIEQDIGRNCFRYNEILVAFKLMYNNIIGNNITNENDSYLENVIFINDTIKNKTKEKK